MPGRMILFVALLLVSGCASNPYAVVSTPTPVPVPAECVAQCPYAGPGEILSNGDLLLAYRAWRDRAACLESRRQCVIDSQPK
jgi:hypothetical protein